MRKFHSIVSLTILVSLLEASDLAYAPNDTLKTDHKEQQEKIDTISEKDKQIKLYSLQLASVRSMQEAKEIVKNLPQDIQKDILLFKIKKYVAIRYKLKPHVRDLKSDLKKIKNLGFEDAYVIQTTKWHYATEATPYMTTMNKNNTPAKKEIAKEIKPSQEQSNTDTKADIQAPAMPIKKVSKFQVSSWLTKANEAYKNGDDMSALSYYEMLFAAGERSDAVINNLSYLYGKQNAWEDAQKVFKNEKNIFKYLYAYEYGAVQTNKDQFLKDMAEYIQIDKSGKLALLAGYYFEQNDDFQKAFEYYKMAFFKNQSNAYNAFAYARSLDIQDKKIEAMKYYKKALSLKGLDKKTKEIIARRIEIIRRKML